MDHKGSSRCSCYMYTIINQGSSVQTPFIYKIKTICFHNKKCIITLTFDLIMRVKGYFGFSTYCQVLQSKNSPIRMDL